MKRKLLIGIALGVCGVGVFFLITMLMEWHRGRVVYRMTEVCHPCAQGSAINNLGQVAGTVTIQKGANGEGARTHAAVWSHGAGTTDLGTLGGVESKAQDLNDKGRVVGLADLKPIQTAYYGPRQPSDGFLWERGQALQSLTELIKTYGLDGISPVGINNRGQVVGCVTLGWNDGYHAFLWDPEGGLKDLGTLSGKYSCAVDVNDQGQVIGNSELIGRTDERASHGFLWEAGKGMRDLGTLGGIKSYARDINNAGQIVGSSDTREGSLHAFLWESAQGMRDLGTLGGTLSTAAGINDAGVVVGDSSLSGDVKNRPFLWEEGRGMRDLLDLIDPEDPLHDTITPKLPRAINNRGQILMDGEVSSDMKTYSVILSPAPQH